MSPKDCKEDTTTTTTTTTTTNGSSSDRTYEPKQFIEARSSKTTAIVAGRLYDPTTKVDIKNNDSIIDAVIQFMFIDTNNVTTTAATVTEKITKEMKEKLTVKVVTGGITNALFRVSGLSTMRENDSNNNNDNDNKIDSVLVRIFGAEGMIDRDVETCTFAALADNGIAPPYYGRFDNGRLEGWLDNYVPLSLSDFQVSETNQEIAVQMANLHAGFTVPDGLKEWHNENEPGLWGQLFSWMEQAKGIEVYKTETDNDRAKALLDLNALENELKWVKTIISDDCKVGFCHNDLLPANVMKHQENGAVKLIDFEYGGVNFVAFDIANHLNEWAGGPDNDEGKTDYGLFPNEKQQRDFVSSYIQAASDDDVSDDKIESLLGEVKAFLLANHLYWGLWAVNQAAAEGTEEFDFMAYAVNRFNRYYETK